MTHADKHHHKAKGHAEAAEPEASAAPPAAAPAETGGEAHARLEQEKGELVLRLQRLTADFQNAQKRAEREKGEIGRFAVGEFAKHLLPGLDNLERALALPIEHPDAQAIQQGVKIVLEQILAAFAAKEIRPIDQVGGLFDPEIHNALMQQPSDQPAMTVLQVVQKGYEMGGRTLRAAQVIVSSGPAQGAAAGANNRPPDSVN